MHLAAENGHEKIIESLFKNHVLVNQGDNNGKTPLHLAVAHKKIDAVKMLMSEGADPFMKDNDDVSALLLAQELEDAAIIKELTMKK